MITLPHLRLPALLGLLLCACVLSACPKQQPATDSAAPGSTASGDSASGAVPADSGEGSAAPDSASNPIEQQQAADAAADKVPQPGPDSTETELKEERKMMSAEEVYKAGNCAMCHGADLNGTPLGPPLKGVKANWDVPNLIAYFKDPATYAANDPRLAANKGKYSVPMPPLRVADREMTTLAEWLLEQ